MKKDFKKISYLFMAATILSSTFFSCDSDDNLTPKPEPSELVLKGELTAEKKLLSGQTYELVGGYQVKDGGKLIIEEGVTIKATRSIDGQPDYIIVEQGGQIEANGTKDKPVVMTSTKEEPGAWGGLHICGKAPINLAGETGTSEIGDADFGGSYANDNSGTLRHLRLE